MLSPMEVKQALADLTEISSQIQAAVVFDDKGAVAGSTIGDEARARELARAAADLLEQAEAVKVGNGALNQLEAATLDGSVFVIRDGPTRIAATTAPEPTVGLVFYDLKSALRQITAKPAPKPKPAARKATPSKKTSAPRKKSTPRKKSSGAP
jgi:predicted regulator of Ras-like GTPase activity (Roadblock/LC7/MglB family)